jgi:hypothetical protein
LKRYLVRSLYIVDMVRTRGIRTMAIGYLEGGGYCGGLHCRQAPVLRACGCISDCREATLPWCGEHHCSHFAVTGGPMTTVCPPQTTIAYHSLLREMVILLGTYGVFRGFCTMYVVLRMCTLHALHAQNFFLYQSTGIQCAVHKSTGARMRT